MFICPQCKTKSLHITLSFELPPDSRSDEITLQCIACDVCKFSGLAIYEESRRGAADLVNHFGYFLDANDLASLTAEMETCFTPQNPHCKCTIHQKLGHHNKSGQWDGLAHIALNRSFPLEF